MILSTCTKLSCLSASKKPTSSPMLFWRYFKYMQTSYLLFWVLWGCLVAQTQNNCINFNAYIDAENKLHHSLLSWEPKFCQIWGWWWSINNNISFYFRLFLRKTNDKIFQKIKTKPLLEPFWPLFAQIWAKINFPGKKGSENF